MSAAWDEIGTLAQAVARLPSRIRPDKESISKTDLEIVFKE
jgi:hypothetical protein